MYLFLFIFRGMFFLMQYAAMPVFCEKALKNFAVFLKKRQFW